MPPGRVSFQSQCRRAGSAFRGSGSAAGPGQLSEGQGVPPGRVSFQRSGSAAGPGQLEVRECCWADTCTVDLEIFVVKIFLWFV